MIDRLINIMLRIEFWLMIIFTASYFKTEDLSYIIITWILILIMKNDIRHDKLIELIQQSKNENDRA